MAELVVQLVKTIERLDSLTNRVENVENSIQRTTGTAVPVTLPCPDVPTAPQDSRSSRGRASVPTLVAAQVAWPAPPSAPAAVLQPAPVEAPKPDTPLKDARPSGLEPPPLDDLEYGKIVARYADGRILKGFTYDFYPNKPRFHLMPAAGAPSGKAAEIRTKDLKAVFFVRDFGGNPHYQERKEFTEDDRPVGRKVEVTFKDGEILVGSTVGYDPRRPGFFFIPADRKSNNHKVFAVSAAVADVRFL
ncbi:MAG: hypothetical protein HYY64_10620 [Candidatus Rokubacteria bacterium]|nr:hypothetical protein [Candidatus Rokubacteria bacterium]